MGLGQCVTAEVDTSVLYFSMFDARYFRWCYIRLSVAWTLKGLIFVCNLLFIHVSGSSAVQMRRFASECFDLRPGVKDDPGLLSCNND